MPRTILKESLYRMPVLIISLALILFMAGCGGGGGGGGVPLVPAENVTISGKVDDGTANSPIQNAECRFVNQGGGQRSTVITNENGEYRIVVPPNIEGHISCNPRLLRYLRLSTFSSTKGKLAGETITGENVNPATTVVAQIIESEKSPAPIARKEELLRSIETAQDAYLNLLVALSTRLYAEMLHHNLDANFADGGGNGGGNGDGGGVGGDAGDGGDFSPIPNARCEFVIDNNVGEGWSVLYNAALADFREDGILNRSDLKAIQDIINEEFKGHEKEIIAAFEAKFPLGFGQPYSDITDENGEYFLPIPPNVTGFVRCLPSGQEKLVLATYVRGLAKEEELYGQDVNPATTVFSTNIASKLDLDLGETKENFLADIAGLDVQILQDGGFVSGFQLRPGTAPTNKDVGLVAFSAISLFNILYKNGDNVDYLAALDDFTTKGEVDPAFLQNTLGIPSVQANEYSRVVDDSVGETGSALETDIGSALSTARIIVMVTDMLGGDPIPGATVDIIGDISCDGCGTTTDSAGIVTLTLTGVPAEATNVTVEVSGVSGFGPATATTEVVAFATVNLEIALRDGPPDTTITEGPSGTITANSATFIYMGTDDVTPAEGLVYATYLQGYDSGWSSFNAATSRSYSNLPDGTYTFQVIARDQAGNEDPSPATQTFEVNYTAQPGGVLQFSSSAYSASESGGSVTITVTRTGGSNGAVGVSYATSNGTAAAGSDYTSRNGALSWGNGDSASKIFSVPILNDSVDENNETVNLSLSNPTGGATLGSPSTALVTIIDDDEPQRGALQFSASTYSGNEGANVTITVRRTGGSDGVVGVSYATSNGTATAGSDYTSRSGTLSWGNGDSASKTFSVPILNDSVDENNETVNLALSNPTGGATLGSPRTAVLNIIDSYVPQPGALQFSASTYSVNENGSSVTITVRRTGGSDGAVGVNYATSNGTATAGSDYTSRSGTLSWGNGESASKTFSVPILNDSAYEGDETVNLALSSPTGGATLGSPSTAVLTIGDDEESPAPTIFNISQELLQLNDGNCYDSPGSEPYPGSVFGINFDYDDPDGDASINDGAKVYVPWDNTPWSTFTGDRFAGSIQTSVCFNFGSNTSRNFTVSLADKAGNRSNELTITIPRPPGAN